MPTSFDHLKLLQTSDGTVTVEDSQRGETYHSKFGAVTESLQVFLHNSGVQRRLQSGAPTKVLEIGFGTGLNFLLSAAAAKECSCSLSYTAIEYNLPPIALIEATWGINVPTHLPLRNATKSAISHAVDGSFNRKTVPSGQKIDKFTSLSLLLGDARDTDLSVDRFNAVYHDAFSDRNNPQLWTPGFLKKLRNCLYPDGVLATYSVNRKFRDSLTEAGFRWQKHPGPPGKREVLTATVRA